MAFIDRSGQVFGRLTAISRAGTTRDGTTLWECKCSCGNVKVTRGTSLANGSTKSCGCARARHGHATDEGTTREYNSWKSMRARCSNPKRPEYHRYGGRGISVCERWDSFESFLEDMGPRPTGTTIDRVDNDGNYEPGNCQWSTSLEQNNNNSSNRWITVNGECLNITGWSRKLGIAHSVVASRLRSGWNEEAAVTTPIKKPRRKSSWAR